MSARERLGLYPPIEPYRIDRLDVGDGHTLYYELCGNPAGRPVVFLRPATSAPPSLGDWRAQPTDGHADGQLNQG